MHRIMRRYQTQKLKADSDISVNIYGVSDTVVLIAKLSTESILARLPGVDAVFIDSLVLRNVGAFGGCPRQSGLSVYSQH